MKKLYLLGSFLLSLTLSFGQSDCEIITNHSFENFTCGAPSVHLLQDACAAPWGCYHFRPGVFGQPGGGPNNFGDACDGEVFVVMDATNEDAIFYDATANSDINFGDWYEFSFCVKSLATFGNPNAASTVSYTIYAMDNFWNFPTCSVWPNDSDPIILPSEEFLQPIASGSLDYTGNWVTVDVPSIQIDPDIAVTGTEVTFLILSNSESTSNAWLGFDNFCVSEGECPSAPCSFESNLSACPTTNSTGYIYVECSEFVSYDWDLPNNSSGIEVSNSQGSAIVNASPGTYVLRTTNEFGCQEVHEYTVIENCCEVDPNACNPPLGLDCQFSHGYLGMSWDPVPSATSYKVRIIVDDNGPSGCGCSGLNYDIKEYTTTSTTYWYYPAFTPCLSWQVKAICEEGVESDWSEVMCYTGGTSCSPAEGEGEGKLFDSNDFGTKNQRAQKPTVYPNPTNGQINYEIELEKSGDLDIEIFDTQGKLIKRYNFENVEVGLFKTTLDAQGEAAGVYIINTRINDLEYRDRLMIID